MNQSRNESPKMQSPVHQKRFSALIFILILALLAAASPVRADEADDQYLDILSLIEAADALTNGPPAAALAKYREAQTALYNFQQTYPKWNAKAIAFRDRYLGEKTDALREKIKLAAAHSTDAQPETKTAAAASSPGAEQIKLLDAGAEPRAVLRLHPKVGAKQTLNILLKMGMDIKMAEMQSPAVKMPRMSITMDFTVKDVSPDGDITYDMLTTGTSVADDPEATPMIAAAMKTSLDGLKGVSGTGRMSNHGLTKTMEMKFQPGASPQARQMADNMKESMYGSSMLLPDEAVGPGAKWEVKQKRVSQGLTIDETATYELVSAENDRVTAKSTTVQHAANQKIPNPAMPGMKADLDKMDGSGTGTFLLDLSQLLPRESTADMHSEMSMGMSVGGQKQPMDMKMDVSVHMEAK